MPFTYIEYDSNARLWPGVRRAYDLVDRYQLVGSYGLFRRMTGVGGRPEVVIEGSHDAVSWTVREKVLVSDIDMPVTDHKTATVILFKHAAEFAPSLHKLYLCSNTMEAVLNNDMIYSCAECLLALYKVSCSSRYVSLFRRLSSCISQATSVHLLLQ